MKKSKFIKIFNLIAIFLLMITFSFTFIMPKYVLAGTPSSIDPEDWEPPELSDGEMEELTDSAGIIVDVIRIIGIIATVVFLIIVGIRYMLGSIEERAEYKKSMKAYIIGVAIFFSLSQLIPILIDLATAFDT